MSRFFPKIFLYVYSVERVPRRRSQDATPGGMATLRTSRWLFFSILAAVTVSHGHPAAAWLVLFLTACLIAVHRAHRLRVAAKVAVPSYVHDQRVAEPSVASPLPACAVLASDSNESAIAESPPQPQAIVPQQPQAIVPQATKSALLHASSTELQALGTLRMRVPELHEPWCTACDDATLLRFLRGCARSILYGCADAIAQAQPRRGRGAHVSQDHGRMAARVRHGHARGGLGGGSLGQGAATQEQLSVRRHRQGPHGPTRAAVSTRHGRVRAPRGLANTC